MGATGVPGPSKHCSWEGATLPELVRGQLQGGSGLVAAFNSSPDLLCLLSWSIQWPPMCHSPAGYFIEEVSCGMHHVVALGRLLDRQLGRPGGHAACATFAWGRGSEGQLGVKSFEDSSTPMLIDALKGRAVLQVRRCSPDAASLHLPCSAVSLLCPCRSHAAAATVWLYASTMCTAGSQTARRRPRLPAGRCTPWPPSQRYLQERSSRWMFRVQGSPLAVACPWCGAASA